MANIFLSWVPANNANATGQIAKAIAKINGSTPNITTQFSPSNTMIKTVSSTVFSTINTNMVYRFTIETICSVGGPTPNTNGVQEEIVFECVNPTALTGDITNNTYKARVIKGIYSIVDGVSYAIPVSSIQGVEYTLYNAANTVLISGPALGVLTGTGSNEAYTHTFTGLVASTGYTLRLVLLSIVNGVLVRSDSPSYLNGPCVSVINTTATAPSCIAYTLSNPAPTQGGGAAISYNFIDCDGVIQNSVSQVVDIDQSVSFCARENTVVSSGGDLTNAGFCSGACVNYRLVPANGSSQAYSYKNCSGVTIFGTVPLNGQDEFCAEQGSVIFGSGTLTQIGACFNGSPCLTYTLNPIGSASVEWRACDGTPASNTFTTSFSFCSSDSYNITQGSATLASAPSPCT